MQIENQSATQIQFLSDAFPAFKKFIKDSHDWLEWAKNQSIFEQLESRKINRFYIWPMLSTAGMGTEKDSSTFFACFNKISKLEYAFDCLGHEICHTFHFDLTKKPPQEIINQTSREFCYNFDNEGNPEGFIIEDICNDFAKKWLDINTKEKIAKDCKDRNDILASMILFFSNNREKEYTI